MVTFKEILNEQQFEIYLPILENNIEINQQALIETDKSYIKQVTAAEDKLIYYKDILLPAFDYREINLRFFQKDYYKINFLKNEYKLYLNDNKKKMLVNHFKNSKTFQPNLLKLVFYQHEVECLLPNYKSFKLQMDEPTKAVAIFLKEKLHRFFLNKEEIFNKIFKELIDFEKANTAEHIGKMQGWHVPIDQYQLKEEIDEMRLMTFVLLDNRNLYVEKN